MCVGSHTFPPLLQIEKSSVVHQEKYTSDACKEPQLVLSFAEARAVQGDRAEAFEVLLNLMRKNPSHARAANRFRERHKIPETMNKALLDLARDVPEIPGTELTDAFPQGCGGRPLCLKGKTEAARGWMDVAKDYFREGKNHQGLDIWFAVFSE